MEVGGWLVAVRGGSNRPGAEAGGALGLCGGLRGGSGCAVGPGAGRAMALLQAGALPLRGMP